jgi:HAE1 family hydrophobic/amphiphilic exporter-1
MSRLTSLSLRNRTVVLLLALLIIVVGVYSARSLKQETIPSTDWPGASVIAIYPGASPSTVETEVAKPIEDAVKTVDNIKTFNSISSSNTFQMQIEWEWGEDFDKMMSDIRSAVDSADLPQEVEDPFVSGGSFDSVPIMIVAVASDKSGSQLTQDVDDVIVPALKDLSGVRDVRVAGDEQHEVVITFDIKKMNAEGVDPASVRELFAANSEAFPSGTVRTDESDIDVQTGRTFKSAAEIADLELQGEDKPFRLGDFASVEERPVELQSASRVNSRDAITLSIMKETDANTVAVGRAVNEKFDQLERDLGADTEFEAVFDQAPFVEQSIHDLTLEGGIGLLMAVLIILLFLRSIRPTVISAISIPLSLLFAIIGLLVGGYTMNMFTMGALAVAVGRVVDDSIVVVENIKRHQGLGETGVRTLIRSVREVAGAVTTSTLTTVAVFLPIGMVGGQAGAFFRPFALTVTVALLASLFVSLTVVPVLASYIMSGRPTKGRQAEVHDEANTWLQHAYLPVLNWALAHRAITLVLAVLIFMGNFLIGPFLKTDFIGASQEINLQVVQTMPTGTSLKKTSAAAREVEAVLDADPNLNTYSTSIGAGSSVFIDVKNDVNKATFTALLDDDADPLSSAKHLRETLAKHDGIGEIEVAVGQSDFSSKLVLFVESPDRSKLADATNQTIAMMQRIDGVENITSDLGEQREMLDVDVNNARAAKLGMTQAGIGAAVLWAVHGQKIGEVTLDDDPIDVLLRSGEPATTAGELRNLTLPISQKMTKDAREDAGDVLEDRGDRLADEIEDEGNKQYRKGLEELEDQYDELTLKNMRKKMRESERKQLREQREQLDDQLDEMRKQHETQDDFADRQDDLKDAGDVVEDLRPPAVSLRDVASVDSVTAPSAITRVDGARAVTISAASEGKDVGATTAAIKAGLAKLNFEDGVTVRVGGVSEQQAEAFSEMGAAMLVAIALVYLIMVAAFRSLLQPLILLVSIPFAATGALGLSALTDTPIGVPSMIGMLMLIGIVVTNAIVLIDLINQKRASGAGIEEAVAQGARLRVRPIVMTALATVGALTPMALGITGGGAFISKPLAVIVIGGLLTSTLLTLLIVPVLYDLVENGRKRWLQRHHGTQDLHEELAHPAD